MSVSIICHGCGKRFPVGDDYARNKIRCPDCGVICAVPSSAGKGAAAKPRPAEAAAPPAPPPQAFDPPSSPRPPEPGPARPAPVPKKSVVVTCDNCGERMRVAKRPEEPARCPVCGDEIRRGTPRGRHAEAAWGSPPPAPAAQPEAEAAEEEAPAAEDEDGPYGLTGGPDRFCPDCSKLLPRGAQLCVRCGLDLRTNQKTTKVYQRVELEWESGLSFRARLRLFAAGQVFCLAMGVGAFLAGALPAFALGWLVWTAMTGFLLGTFDRVNLARDERGKTALAKTWRIFFWPQATQPIRLSEYEGVTTNRVEEVGNWDSVNLLLLQPRRNTAGQCFYFAIYRPTYQVALTSDHGYAACILYRGVKHTQAIAIAEAVRDVTGLPYDGS